MVAASKRGARMPYRPAPVKPAEPGHAGTKHRIHRKAATKDKPTAPKKTKHGEQDSSSSEESSVVSTLQADADEEKPARKKEEKEAEQNDSTADESSSTEAKSGEEDEDGEEEDDENGDDEPEVDTSSDDNDPPGGAPSKRGERFSPCNACLRPPACWRKEVPHQASALCMRPCSPRRSARA